MNQWRVPEWFPHLSEEALEALRLFHTELGNFNPSLNLVSERTMAEADLVHFADCIQGSFLIRKDLSSKRIFDFGSGNGLPGIVFALLFREIEVVLVERDSRKAEFLKYCISRLGLKNAAVFRRDLQDLQLGAVGCAMARGLASVSKMALMTREILAPGDVLYLFKGANWSTEVSQVPSQLFAFWRPVLLGSYGLPVGNFDLNILKVVRIGK